MSAKDAPGEVNKDKVFDSPSSSSGDDEIIYKAADIKKRRKTEFFVNVEGAEERAKAAQKRLEEEEKAIAKAEKDLQKIADAEQAEVDRELVEERKKVDEVNAYIQKQRKEKVKAEVKERNKKRNSRITKIVAIAVAAVAVIAIAVITVVNLVIIPEQKRLAEEEEQRRIDEQVKAEFLAIEHNAIIAKLNVDADLFEAVENYHFDDVKRIYAEYLEDVTDNETKAYVYLDMADRIAAHTTDEYDEIINALETARIYAPKDTYVLRRLRDAYLMVDNNEQVAAIDEELKEIGGKRPTDEELEEQNEEEDGQG
ncbi:hypothetical protein IJM16_02355 [Candidatus Saccharibacteria bacterium]|nr:hypothetical protein [Candidatus Saccharibacteria bacterium]